MKYGKCGQSGWEHSQPSELKWTRTGPKCKPTARRTKEEWLDRMLTFSLCGSRWRKQRLDRCWLSGVLLSAGEAYCGARALPWLGALLTLVPAALHSLTVLSHPQLAGEIMDGRSLRSPPHPPTPHEEDSIGRLQCKRIHAHACVQTTKNTKHFYLKSSSSVSQLALKMSAVDEIRKVDVDC